MNKITLCLASALMPVLLFAQIGTNPASPYSGVQSQGLPSQGAQSQGSYQGAAAKKSDSGTLKNVYYSTSVKFIGENSLRSDSLSLSALDTSIVGFEHYSQLFRPDRFTINLGNLGLPLTPLIPEFDRIFGFSDGQHVLSSYLLEPADLLYYRNKSPFTEVFYVSGKGKKSGFADGSFRFVHARNINPRLNIGLYYSRIGSNGYYRRQTSDVLNTALFSWYQSRNLRYNLLANFILNGINADENGGLRNDSVFTVPTTVQHQYEDINLSNAATNWSSNGLYLKQYLLIGRIDSSYDRITKQIKVYPTARAFYTFYLNNIKYGYTDGFNSGFSGQGQGQGSGGLGPNGRARATSFYPNIFLDTLKTDDRTDVKRIVNEFGLSLFGRSRTDRRFSASGIRLEASLKDELVHYRQNGKIDSSFNTFSLNAKAGYDLSGRFSLRVDGNYGLTGFNKGDAYLAGNAFLSFGQAGSFAFKASFQASAPELVYNRYESNSYSWTFRFLKENTKLLSAEYSNTLLLARVSLTYHFIDHYLYFAGIANQVVFPNQFPDQVRIIRLKAEKDFRAGVFGLNTYLLYQQNNVPKVVRTPELYLFASPFVQKTLFSVLRLKLGIEGTWFSKFLAPDYAPGLQQFFIYSNKMVGQYPVINLYVVAGIKRTNLILRYDYLNQNLPQRGYYNLNKYPAADRLFKFGLSWKFYD